MYCKFCGSKIKDGDVFCINCGRSVDMGIGSTYHVKEVTEFDGESKTGIGVLCAIFLGVLGLLVGYMYPPSSLERKTFLRGWGIAFTLTYVIVSIIGFIGCCVTLDYYMEYFKKIAKKIL